MRLTLNMSTKFEGAILFLMNLANLHKMAVATDNNERMTRSQFGYRFLDSRVLFDRKTTDLKACFDLCMDTVGCGSGNYKINEGVCELHSKSHFTHPQNLEKRDGFIYMPVLDIKQPKVKPAELKYKTCAQLKEMKPSSPSGVYELQVNGSTKAVYCDMVNFGGGWALVVSISASNKKHLLQTENNCFNSTLCVPLATGTLVARKNSDADIRALASHEGTFRIDVTSTINTEYYSFYRLAQGTQVFDSSCYGFACPRIIVSYAYPYVWESNCFGTEKGYQIPKTDCHRVFDSHDSTECGYLWTASQQHAKRVLYNYCRYNGIYASRQGNMYVR